MECKILIIEDEASIRSLLRASFQGENYRIFESTSGEEGIALAREEHPSVVILDIMLPGIDGFTVCQCLRKEFQSMGIIILTARAQDIDKISGLECGADDYLSKPFNPAELVLRVKALLRRLDPENMKDKGNIIQWGPFSIDTDARIIYKEDEVIEMTPKEYLLTKLFIENPGKAFTRDELLNLIWGWDFFGDSKIVDVNMRRLRTKIEDDSSNPVFIETVWGTGYRWKK